MTSIYEIWNELQEFGYTCGDGITYCDFVQCCENVNTEPSEHILDSLSSICDVTIG